MPESNVPVGIKHKNPLNLKNNPLAPWRGSTGSDSKNHAIFSEVAWGLRAAMKNFFAYWKKGRKSIRQIVESWAPASDWNDPEDYIAYLMQRLKVPGDDENADFLGIVFAADGTILRFEQLYSLLFWMAKMECGAAYELDYEDFARGIRRYYEVAK